MHNTTPTPTTDNKTRVDLHQKVTDTIVQHLETGTTPWQKPWIGSEPTPLPYAKEHGL